MELGWRILGLALVGATATMGLKTGSLSPWFPAVTRADKPRKFWLGIGICVALVAASCGELLLSIWRR
jgi:hypothetical protein